MGTVDLPGKPNIFPPQEPAFFRDLPGNDDLQKAVKRILKEETVKVTRYLSGKISAEIIDRLDIEGYFKRHYGKLFKQYLSSANTDAAAAVTRHSAGEIAELLRSLGGAGKFNSGEIEKSTDSAEPMREALRRKTDMGKFLHAETAGSMVKCVFRDNALKPATVTDVKLAVNIPDTELIAPVFYRYAAANYLIKDCIGKHVIESIDKEINASPGRDLEERITQFFDGNAIGSFDMANIRENIGKSAHIENMRGNGFSMIVNLLTAIVNAAGMDYQFIEHNKNGRALILREYEHDDAANLPDERYQIRLRYYDSGLLIEECNAYDAQFKNLEGELRHLWDLIEVIYQDSKSVFKVNDFEDLAQKNKSRIRGLIKKKTGEPLYEIAGGPGVEKGGIPARLARMHERIRNMYEFLYPIERRVMEERLARLEREYSRLDFMVNPRLLQPGLLIDLDMTSIKRRKTTLDAMAAVLNEFLRRAFSVFQDAAFALSFGAEIATNKEVTER